MTVRAHVKAHRRGVVAEHARREYERTGRNGYEQWLDSIADLHPVHRRINQRAEDEASRRWHEEFWRRHRESVVSANWSGYASDPAQDAASLPRDAPAVWPGRPVVHPDDAELYE